MSEVYDILPVEPKEGVIYSHKEREKAIWEATVRSTIFMRPGYSLITDPMDIRLHVSNKKIKNPQDFDVKEMAKTLVGHHLIQGGVGLAAPQIGWNARVCAISILDENERVTRNTVVFFNPRIIGTTLVDDSNIEFMPEACLSVPGVTAEVCRLKTVRFLASTFQNPQEREYTARGLFAQCIQHEVAHLKGKLFLDEQHVRNVQRQDIV